MYKYYSMNTLKIIVKIDNHLLINIIHVEFTFIKFIYFNIVTYCLTNKFYATFKIIKYKLYKSSMQFNINIYIYYHSVKYL